MRALLLLLAGCVAAVAVPVYMRASEAGAIFFSEAAVPHAQVAIVLGASVVRGEPSPVLRKRADAAIALYQRRVVEKILVTGDNGALSHDEVTPVRKYLTDTGVAPEDIFLDHAGFDTYSSMYRARDIFEANSAIIVTQDFHLPRALWIAHRLGLTAYGFAAADVPGSLYSYAREIPASWKALFDVLLHRQPKYLGEHLPLDGDGQATWY